MNNKIEFSIPDLFIWVISSKFLKKLTSRNTVQPHTLPLDFHQGKCCLDMGIGFPTRKPCTQSEFELAMKKMRTYKGK